MSPGCARAFNVPHAPGRRYESCKYLIYQQVELEEWMRKIVGILIVLAAVSACRSRPVSVVTPEVSSDAADLTPLSTTGDTSWRASAFADMREHENSAHATPRSTAGSSSHSNRTETCGGR